MLAAGGRETREKGGMWLGRSAGQSIFIVVRGYLERNGSTASLEPLSSSACFPAFLQQSTPRLWLCTDNRRSIHKTLSDLKTSYT